MNECPPPLKGSTVLSLLQKIIERSPVFLPTKKRFVWLVGLHGLAGFTGLRKRHAMEAFTFGISLGGTLSKKCI